MKKPGLEGGCGCDLVHIARPLIGIQRNHRACQPSKGRMKIILLSLSLLFSSSAAASFLESLFIPKARALSQWEVSNEANRHVIDHAVWQALLDLYLDAYHPSAVWRFRYDDFSTEDRTRLRGYLRYLQNLDPTEYSRSVQMAYWINLYNAQTVALILEHPEVNSIRDLKSGLFSIGPWKLKLIKIGAEKLSLDDVEHRILRPIFGDPRIHFALNCASIGCPNLSPKAYTARNVQSLLDAGARAYISHPRGAHFEDQVLVLSSVFDWFGEDFGGSREERLRYLAGFAEPDLAARLRSHRGEIRYEYNWKLNRP